MASERDERRADGGRAYFAALPAPECAAAAVRRVEDYFDFLRETGLRDLWRKSHVTYYGGSEHKGRIQRAGKQAQFRKLIVNHYRNLLQHLHTLTTSQPPSYDTQASNTDQKSMEQSILGNSLLDYYNRDKALGRVGDDATESALLYGEGFVEETWNTALGEVYGADPADPSRPVFEGDIEYEVLDPWQVVRDFTRESSEGHEWYITVKPRNRFALAARYPELAARILEVPSKDELDKRYQPWGALSDKRYPSDEVPLYTLYHRRGPLMPQGRVFQFLTADLWLLDSPSPYRQLPVRRITGGEWKGSIFGYTVGYDLLPLVDAYNGTISTILTNQAAFGVQNVWVPAGANLNVKQVSEGLTLIESDPKMPPPEGLSLVASATEISTFLETLGSQLQVVSGINSVVRGDPEASLKSGSALALVQATAIQFSANLQKSYAKFLADLGTDTLVLLRDFAKTERVAAITGRNNRQYLKSFTGDDLELVNRVHVDLGNPVSRTIAGKVELARDLVQLGFVTTGEQYINVRETGRVEPLYEGTQAELMLIRGENEALSQGTPVPVIITDNDITHIMEHKAVLASVEARSNPAIVKATTAHLQMHIDQLMSRDPLLAKALGLPSAMEAMMAAGGVATGVQPAPDAPGAQPSAQPGVAMPQMPVNPATGERASEPQPQGA